MSVGGGSSKSSSSSNSEGLKYGANYTQGGAYLDPLQQQAQLQFQQQFNPMLGPLGPGVTNAVNQSRAYLTGAQNQLTGAMPAWMQSARAGMGQLQQFAQQNNPYLNSQIHGLGQDLGRFYREQILPGIGGRYAQAGQRGGSRQGIAEGQAAGRIGEEFAQQANAMRMGAYGQQQAAAGQLAALGQQGLYSGYGALGNLAGTNMQNMLGYQGMQLNPFQIGAQIYGAPSVLSWNQGGGFDYGYEQSSSQSKGKGSQAQVGFI